MDAAKEMVKKLTVRFDPENFENPKLQNFYNNLEAMALDRDEPEAVEDHTGKRNSANLTKNRLFPTDTTIEHHFFSDNLFCAPQSRIHVVKSVSKIFPKGERRMKKECFLHFHTLCNVRELNDKVVELWSSNVTDFILTRSQHDLKNYFFGLWLVFFRA